MKSENVKERPLTKLNEYAILISKHWKRSKTGADDCDPTSILVNFKEDIEEVIKNKLISDGWTKTVWHKVADGDLPKKSGYYYCHYRGVHSGEYYEANYEMCWNSEKFMTDRSNEVIAWTELPKYKE